MAKIDKYKEQSTKNKVQALGRVLFSSEKLTPFSYATTMRP